MNDHGVNDGLNNIGQIMDDRRRSGHRIRQIGNRRPIYDALGTTGCWQADILEPQWRFTG